MKLHQPSKATNSYLILAMCSLLDEIQARPTLWPTLAEANYGLKDMSTSLGVADKTSLKDSQQLHNAWAQPLYATPGNTWGQQGNGASKMQLTDTRSPPMGMAAVADGTKVGQASNGLNLRPANRIDIGRGPRTGTGVFLPSESHNARVRASTKAAASKISMYQKHHPKHRYPLRTQPKNWQSSNHPNFFPEGYVGYHDQGTNEIYAVAHTNQPLARVGKEHDRFNLNTVSWERWVPAKIEAEKPKLERSSTFNYGGHTLPLDPFGLESVKSPQGSQFTKDTTPKDQENLGHGHDTLPENLGHFHNLLADNRRAIQA